MKEKLEKEKKKDKFISNKKYSSAEKQEKYQKTEQKNREQEPISWKQSEAIQHMYGENSMETKEKTTGLYDRQGEHSTQKQMREVFRAANSYGNIAVGANKKQEGVVVFSQTREHNEKTTEEKQKNLNMERKKKELSTNGEFLMNNSQFQKSAWAYKGNTKVSDKKVLDEIKEYGNREESRMLEKRMPFLLLEKDKKQLVYLREQIRERYEKGDEEGRQILERQKETLQHEIQQKEQNEKMITTKIKVAWKKAQKIVSNEFEIRRRIVKQEEEEPDDLSEDSNSEENSSKKNEK